MTDVGILVVVGSTGDTTSIVLAVGEITKVLVTVAADEI